jgi:hemerythrin-like domain-containing protein
VTRSGERRARQPSDPVRRFEHTHGELNRLVLDVAESLRALDGASAAKAWKDLVLRLATLRDELLRHFADEEEALFPFVRASVPAKTDVVERLEAAHDTLCGSVMRAHEAAGKRQAALLRALHERFESSYVRHSREEAELFEGLGKALDAPQRAELAELLRGL